MLWPNSEWIVMMVESFTPDRQGAALIALVTDVKFLHTDEGKLMLAQIREHVAASLAAYSRRDRDFPMETDEVLHLLIDRLISTHETACERAARIGDKDRDGRSPAERAADAERPWGYLFQCGKRWVNEASGIRGVSDEVLEYYAPAEHTEEDLTPISDLVKRVHQILRPRVEPCDHEPLYRLLTWLAENPPQRRTYEHLELIAAQRAVPEFTSDQVSAVMNIAWGGRPKRADTSLMGQVLLNEHFDPTTSPSHYRALTTFKQRMRAAARPRFLTERIAS